MTDKNISQFKKTIWNFYRKNKRAFPWRNTKNPYHILVSEIMLQQTQAERVVAYYQKFLKRFPTTASLAKATFSQIYPYWQGLGYNRRALALKKSAEKAVKEFGGKIPSDIETLKTFPGIGEYTARAVSIFSFNTPIFCIETNIRRVFIHFFFAKVKKVSDSQLLPFIEKSLDKKNSKEWHWALMDYGAHLKKTVINPNRKHTDYHKQSAFEGSLRQIRGAVLKILSVTPTTFMTITKQIKRDKADIKKVLLQLEKEGLIIKTKQLYSLK